MQRLFLGLKIAVPTAVLAFVALVVFGVYTALDSATSQYANAAELQTVGAAAEQLIERASLELGTKDCDIDEVEDEQETEPASEASIEPVEPANSAAEPLTANNKKPSAPSERSQNSNNPEQQYRAIEHPAEYTTVTHDAVYRTVTDFYTTCNDCDFKIQGSIYPHQDATGHGRYSTDVPFTRQELVSAAWEEQVLVKEAWTEWVPA